MSKAHEAREVFDRCAGVRGERFSSSTLSAPIGWAIERIFLRGIVFNQSWEDPAMDEASLHIVPDRDVVLTITSGGCNSLNLLCRCPRSLICVDSNPAQTYLLDLKLAGIQRLDYTDFFDVFGGRAPDRSRALYDSALRGALPPPAREFWDENIRLFEKGIFTQGKLGRFLQALRLCVRAVLGEKVLLDLFELESLEEQRAYYRTMIAPRIWSGMLWRALASRPMVYLAGMHPNQYALIAGERGMQRFVRERVEHVLTNVPTRTNYFLAQAVLGRYLDNERVPPYLREANFENLKRTVDRVTNVTAQLRAYLLRRPEASIDKFSLLDIFDWMPSKDFEACMREVIRTATDDGRFVYRSLSHSRPLPADAEAFLVGEPALSSDLLRSDRSGIYGSFYVYRVCKAPGRSNARPLKDAEPARTTHGTREYELDPPTHR